MIGSWTRTPRNRTAIAVLLLIPPLAACDSDSPDPAGPGGAEGPDLAAVTLASNELDAGGTGVVVSDGFAQLELEPAVDGDGAVIPDRWSNLHVTVDGTEVDVRRLDERSMEFSVSSLPGGTYGVETASPFAHGSASVRVFGVVASERVVGCFILPDHIALIPVEDALVFDTVCRTLDGDHNGAGVTWPTVPGRGFEWLPDGEVPELTPWTSAGPSHRPNHFVARRSGASTEFWVWEAGPNPSPVEALSCVGTTDVRLNTAGPAEAGDGSCLLVSPESGLILRDGEPVAEWPRFEFGHFVGSDDGWLTTRGSSRLVVFDAAGELVAEDDGLGRITDARFAPGGGPLYVATGDPFSQAAETTLFVVDRSTGDVLRETSVAGTITAIAISEDRLWVARSTGLLFGGELFADLLDPKTLESRRSIAVTRDLTPFRNLWPYHGFVPVLLEDATGTRLTYTGVPDDQAGVWSHVVEVGDIE